MFGGGIPELPKGLSRDLGSLGTVQQVERAPRDQLLDHLRAESLSHEALLTAIPIGGGEIAQARPQGQRQLLHAAQPILSQFTPHHAQGCIRLAIRWQPAATLQKAGVHQLEEPAAIHLQGPQAIEQLLPLIDLRRRQARAEPKAGKRHWATDLAPAQDQPTQGGPHQGSEHQRNHHRPKPSFRVLLLLPLAPPRWGGVLNQRDWSR